MVNSNSKSLQQSLLLFHALHAILNDPNRRPDGTDSQADDSEELAHEEGASPVEVVGDTNPGHKDHAPVGTTGSVRCHPWSWPGGQA